MLVVGSPVQARDHQSTPSSQVEQEISDLESSPYPYPDEGQPEYDPTDVETSLDGTMPTLGSVFDDVLPGRYFQWKQNLYENHGLKIGLFFQLLYMSASSPNATFDNAFGQWWGFDAKWTPLNKT